MSIFYQNGLGDTLGDVLATCKPLYTGASNVWYVNSTGGVDAATPAGQNREKPLATLAQAITNAADNDIIELMNGHAETLSAALSISKKLSIVGGGSAGGKPTVKIGFAFSPSPALIVGVAAVELRNIWFTPNTVSDSGTRINVAAANFVMSGCYIECGALDLAAGLTLASGADSARISNTTFISVATLVTAQPFCGLRTSAAVADLTLDGVTFSAGAVGYSSYFALDAGNAAVTRLKATSISLLLGADVKLNSASTGYMNLQLVTGGSRVEW